MTDQSMRNPQDAVAPDTRETPPPQSDEFGTRWVTQLGNLLQHGEGKAAAEWQEGLPTSLPARLGRYTLHKLLGKGGMGAVFLAHDTQLDRPVALKIPRFGLHPHPDDQERFLREARAAAVLSHPNLCPVHDAGQIEGISYLTMAYIEGQPLSVVLQHDPSRPIQDSVRLVRQLALAMHEAHRRGIIHRDLKPANVMIDLRGEPVIMDFGLARRGPESGDARLTQSGMVMGTPAYMPPEQVNGDVDAMGPPCDIYSLAVILYEMLAGRLPFLGAFGELMAQIVSVPPPPPSRFRPGLDPEIESICLKGLAKKPAERFASMQAFAAALEGWLNSTAARSAADDAPGARAPQEGRNPGQAPRSDEVSRLYLTARYFLEKRTEESNRKSIATYYQILDRDPSFAPAWAGLAFAYHLLGVRGHASPTSASPKGKSAALQALELDDSLAEAHTSLAAILLDHDWDFAGAERAFRRALELKPDYAVAHQLYGKCLACMGRHAEAIAAIRRAQQLHPLATIFSATLGRHGYFYARRYDEAVREFRKTIETDPTFWIAHYFLGWAHVCQGNFPEALKAFTTASQLDDNPEMLVGLGYAHAASAQPAKAREALDALTALGQRRYVNPVNQGIVYIGLGDWDQAFTWLEKAVEEHAEWLCKIRVDPVFDPLRSDSRFLDLQRRVTGNV